MAKSREKYNKASFQKSKTCGQFLDPLYIFWTFMLLLYISYDFAARHFATPHNSDFQTAITHSILHGYL